MTNFYDNLAGSYDLLISWESRLRRERPFFRRVFKEYKVRRVLDTACGTGMHAVAFHDWGYYVVGADLSREMVEKSRENAADRGIEFVQAGFTELDRIGGMFDAVTCLGNSLPHVLADEELEKSLRCMYETLLPGGVLVVHGNNYDRILARRERFMPLAGGDGHLFLRFFDFHGDTLTFNIITLEKSDGTWRMRHDSSTHRTLTHDLLVGTLEKVGFTDIHVYGGYPDEPYDRLESDNLIVTAQRPHTAASNPPKEPVAALDKVPIIENGEPLLDLADVAPEIERADKPVLLRERVVEMLRAAQASLPSGYRLKVRIGFRTLRFQREMYEKFSQQLAEEHPDWPASQIRRHMNRFLAPPDAKHPPGHTTGGALDVTLEGSEGELDMVSTLDPDVERFAVFPTYSKLITPRAAKNRQMLVDAMTGAGFSSYSDEWWHYSYGDSGWALRTGAGHAVYGAVPDESVNAPGL
ncbi:MAG: methyltransferase domain-containing protein [Armatimonadota bacterium]